MYIWDTLEKSVFPFRSAFWQRFLQQNFRKFWILWRIYMLNCWFICFDWGKCEITAEHLSSPHSFYTKGHRGDPRGKHHNAHPCRAGTTQGVNYFSWMKFPNFLLGIFKQIFVNVQVCSTTGSDRRCFTKKSMS